ncbi:MAG: hypothetical protein ACOX5T_08735 [Candidatus Cryptobacteroides sp.]
MIKSPYGDPGLAAARKGTPGPETRGSEPGAGQERHPRTGNTGFRAWRGAGEAPQDRKVGNLGLAGVRKATDWGSKQ